ncbi:MAG: transposase [Planctomycetota bacterium]
MVHLWDTNGFGEVVLPRTIKHDGFAIIRGDLTSQIDQRRFEIQKRKILKEADIKPQVLKGMLKRLEQFVKPFIACLGRREPKENAHIYISGLLSDLRRKNVESIAYRYDQDRRALQRFIGFAPWDHQPLQQELARQIGNELGEDDGVIVFDPSGHKKCGDDSVGVQRQWLGRLGKVDNGQVGVYMGYASHKNHALADTRLYLPKQWAKDKTRRKKCGVPKHIRYQTRHELALDMLKNNGEYLPHSWIAGDDEMGRSSHIFSALQVQIFEQDREIFRLAVCTRNRHSKYAGRRGL